MTTPITIRAKVRFQRGNRGARKLKLGEAKPAAMPRGRIPRVTRLLALSHWFEKLIADGEVKDYAELARLGHVTRARLSQIMNLLNLAPDIQEEILFFPTVERGRDGLTERQTRSIVKCLEWKKQQAVWKALWRMN
jgi:hypothetical protein